MTCRRGGYSETLRTHNPHGTGLAVIVLFDHPQGDALAFSRTHDPEARLDAALEGHEGVAEATCVDGASPIAGKLDESSLQARVDRQLRLPDELARGDAPGPDGLAPVDEECAEVVRHGVAALEL